MLEVIEKERSERLAFDPRPEGWETESGSRIFSQVRKKKQGTWQHPTHV